MSTKIPLLYQYKSFLSNNRINKSRLRQLLIRNKLFFNSPNEYNDPFECWFSPLPSRNLVNEILSNTTTHPLVTLLIGDGLVRNIDTQKYFVTQLRGNFKNRFFITCLSERKNHPLMLTHYADNHRGYFIEFDFSANSQVFDEWGKNLCKFIQVNYVPETVEEKLAYPVIDNLNSAEQAFDYMVSTKSHDWQYEQEWRIVIDSQRIKASRNTGLILKFPKIFIKGIYLGAKISNENIELLQEISEYANIPLYSSQFNETNFDIFNKRIN